MFSLTEDTVFLVNSLRKFLNTSDLLLDYYESKIDSDIFISKDGFFNDDSKNCLFLGLDFNIKKEFYSKRRFFKLLYKFRYNTNNTSICKSANTRRFVNYNCSFTSFKLKNTVTNFEFNLINVLGRSNLMTSYQDYFSVIQLGCVLVNGAISKHQSMFLKKYDLVSLSILNNYKVCSIFYDDININEYFKLLSFSFKNPKKLSNRNVKRSSFFNKNYLFLENFTPRYLQVCFKTNLVFVLFDYTSTPYLSYNYNYFNFYYSSKPAISWKRL